MSVKIDWTPEKEKAVIQDISNFIKKYEITCGETVQQSEKVLLDLPDFMESLVEIIKPDYEDGE